MTEPPKDDLIRFLEDRFACAQACTECARACALLVSSLEPAGAAPPGQGPVRPTPALDTGRSGAGHGLRRALLLCVEICDATCRLLSEESHQDEYGLRLQVEWCRAVALDCAHACDDIPEAAQCAERCRACARACTDFLATLGGAED
ncbi:ferredoxin [Streptomyces sp. SID14478]|uniref:ferredoxin n=1 Tax=Streptomyces sp. SID14478 TaxID=2706073 RepID=UPI0013DCD661|nr:ferredoxin [Streptomyces sp. SID14478]NEB75880.1 ferredoxin [Streptomyces sp. SID14478]